MSVNHLTHVVVTTCLVTIGSAAVTATSNGPDADGIASLREQLGAVVGADLAEFRPLEGPGTTQRQHVARLLECSDGELGPCEVYGSARLGKDGSPGPEVMVVAVPFQSVEGAARLGLVVNKTGIIAGAAILREDGSLDENWREFLQQLQGRKAPKLKDAKSPGDLTRLRDEALKSDDPKRRLVGALIRNRELMLEQARITMPLFQAFQQGGQPEMDADSMTALHGMFQEMATLSGDLKPALGAAADQYNQGMSQAAQALGQVAEALEKGDQGGLMGLQTAGQACNGCHQLQANPGGFVPLGLQASVGRRRATLGVGNQMFMVGYDLNVPAGDEVEQAQAVAAGVRRALYFLLSTWA